MLLVRTQRIPMSQLALARLPLRVYSITTSPAPLSSGEQSAMLGIAVKVRWGEDWLGVQTRASARLPVKWLRCVNICISYAVSMWNWSGNAPVTALFLSLHFQSVTFGQCTHVESHPPFGTNRQNPRGKADSKRALSHGEPRLICLMTVSPHRRAQNRAHMPCQ